MLTIVIPTRDYLDFNTNKAIQSVIAQTVTTPVRIEIDEKLTGAGPTRNRAIKSVHTKWVGFCDDDDWLDEHYHEWLKQEAPGYDMVIFRMKNQPVGGVPYSDNVDELKYNEVGVSFALKTALAKKFPFRTEIPGEDYDLIIRIKEAGYKIKISPHIAYFIGRAIE